jgi:hypothetical protein
MYKMGYDTLKAYYKQDLCRFLSKRLQQDFKYNTENVFIYNGVKVYLTFISSASVKQTSVSFSIPTLLYGCNTELADVNEVIEAVELMSDILNLEFKQFDISRLDITANLRCSVKAQELQKYLQKPTYFKGSTVVEDTLYCHTADSFKKSGRVIAFYQKDANLRDDLIRAEARFFSRYKDGISASDLIDRFLKHNASVSDLMKESFYINSIYYLYKLIKSAFPRKIKDPEQQAIIEELNTSLETNLKYSLPNGF